MTWDNPFWADQLSTDFFLKTPFHSADFLAFQTQGLESHLGGDWVTVKVILRKYRFLPPTQESDFAIQGSLLLAASYKTFPASPHQNGVSAISLIDACWGQHREVSGTYVMKFSLNHWMCRFWSYILLSLLLKSQKVKWSLHSLSFLPHSCFLSELSLQPLFVLFLMKGYAAYSNYYCCNGPFSALIVLFHYFWQAS